MALMIKQDGKVKDLIIPACGVQILDMEDNFESSNLEEVLQEIGEAESVYIGDEEPNKDGLWIDTTDTVSDENSADENIVAKQIKKYMNNKIGDLNMLNTNVKDNLVNAVNTINKNTSQLSNITQEIENVKTNYAKKTDVNALASNKADNTAVQALQTQVNNVKIDYAKKTDVNALASNKAEKSTVQALDIKVNQLTSDTPKGIYDTLELLKSAFPTGTTGKYIVGTSTEEKHWYIWNGSAWIDGGVYQGIGIADSIITENKFDAKLKSKLFSFEQKAYQNTILFTSFYKNGVLQTNQGNYKVLTYDVSKDDVVYINRIVPAYVDKYSLFNANGDIVSYSWNSESSPVTFAEFIDCSGATTLAISHINTNSPYDLGYETAIIKGYRSALDINVSTVTLEPKSILENYAYHVTNGLITIPGFDYIEYDVSNFNQVRLKADLNIAGSQYVYIYLLYDKDGEVVRKRAHDVSTNVDTELNCTDIVKIGISIHKSLLSTLLVTASTSNVLKTVFEDKKQFTNEIETINARLKTLKPNPWDGKKIVWFGTSIPAGGKDGRLTPLNYPSIVGDILGATVYNEAVGSSPVHCKIPSRINENNPYGFNHGFDTSSRCLTNTLEEMEYIINNFNNTNIFDYNTVSSLSDSDKEFIRDCSYERKLAKYLSGGSIGQCDLYVFNHGFNDTISDEQEAYYNAKEELTPTRSDTGFYNNGTYVSGSVEQSKHYDVTNIKAVVISGTFSQYYDFYDLFDAQGKNLKHLRNLSVNETVNITLDVSNATKLVVSNNPSNMATVKIEKLIYGMPDENLYCYRGAMNFLINKIREDNPRARIVMIGEYENQKYPKISEYQKIVANDWNIPLYELWNQLGWSQRTVKTTGYWNDGLWIESGGTKQDITYLNLWCADGVHPHSDLSGKAINFMADNIASWINNNIR